MIFFLTILNLFHNGSCICKAAGNTDIKVHSFIRNCKFLDSLISTNTAFCDLMHGFFAVIRSQAAENCFCNTSCNTEDNTTTGAEAALRQALPVLHQAAQQALYKAHSPQTARLKLERLDFAPRDYGSFALPGGRYTALRVELGEGKGHNWFCVLYPALCVSGAQAKYPSQAENALVFGRYEVRFAVVDAVKNWIQQ